MTNKPRKRKCKAAGCDIWFYPRNTLQKACSPRCAIELERDRQKRERKRELREAKEKLKTRSDWLREAQTAVNAWVRWRDRRDPCISCGRFTGAKRNAGHYRSVGACPELRFAADEYNINAQCEHCNSYLSGNIHGYRQGLLKKIGRARLEWLEGSHAPKRYRTEEIKAIRDQYRERLKQAKRNDG